MPHDSLTWPRLLAYSMALSLVTYEDSSSDSEADEERPQKAGGEQDRKSDVRKMLGLLPPPRGCKTSKQPVRIGLPTVEARVSLSKQASIE